MKPLIIISVLFSLPVFLFAKITPAKLTCEYMQNPHVIDVMQPRLGWINVAEVGERGQIQTAWQIRVAS